ncbi:hypothetical protein [Vibrio mexicanus]|uniref:hypothetical protein n=1 Tax=Vibrio mexicanus TaxID=1004326 RepID=UPI00069A9831|nr:hypothetical protein [Vibrio mexicanus]
MSLQYGFRSSLLDFINSEVSAITEEMLQPLSSTTITALQSYLSKLPHLAGDVLLDVTAPTTTNQITALVFYRGIVFAIDLQLDDVQYHQQTSDQIESFTRDLKAKHKAALSTLLVPIYLAGRAEPQGCDIAISADLTTQLFRDSGEYLADIIEHMANQYKADKIFINDWLLEA